MSPPPLTSQSLTNSSQALRTTSSSSSIHYKSSHSKISLNSLDSDPSLSRISHMQNLFEKNGQNPLLFLILGLNRWPCWCLRAYHNSAPFACISEFRLGAHLLAQRMHASGALSGMSPRLAHVSNSSFFQILPRTQLQEWCAQLMAH